MSKWRTKYKVHPAADAFPMMSDAALANLGRDIKANGLKHPICFYDTDIAENDTDSVLIDGRNRLEAMERAGIGDGYIEKHHYRKGDPVSHIIGLNIHRRHLSQQERADLIVAAVKAGKEPRQRSFGGVSGAENKLGQLGPVSEKGGRGKKSPIKEEALAVNTALPKEQRVSERTIKRAIAKSEGRAPKPKQYAARPMPKPRSGKPVVGIDAVRQCYLDHCAAPDVDLGAEQKIITAALHEIAGKRAMLAGTRGRR